MLKLKKVPKWEEVLNFWEEVKNNNNLKEEYKILLGFVLLTGLRISEVLSIKREDIDFKNKLVRVQQKKKRKEAYREVFVPNDLLDLIKSSNWQKFNISRRWAYYIVKKRTSYHPHAFRHSFALMLISKTKNLEVVRRLLGHSNYNVIKEYLNYTIEDIKEIVSGIYEN
jgi:integrase